MAEPHAPDTDHSTVDPERDRAGNPFDHGDGLTGQTYSREREAEMGRQRPSGHALGDAPEAAPTGGPGHGADVPPDNGRRGSFDSRSGEVRGSGAGAGGGGDGDEDFDTGTAGGAPEAPYLGERPDRRN